MKSSSAFWEKIASRYANRPIENQAAYERKLSVTRSYLRPHMQLLELGCGTGSTAIAHAPYVDSIRATDFSSNMLTYARDKARSRGIKNVSFNRVSVEGFEAEDGSFDMILALSLLHLLEDRQAALAKMYRLLQPGGILVTSTVCLGDKMAWIRPVAPVMRLFGVFPLLKVFTTQQLKNDFEAAGFTLEYEWRPSEKEALFAILRRADGPPVEHLDLDSDEDEETQKAPNGAF